MEQLKLGQLIGPEQQRDAIHIAVAPVTSKEYLRPGMFIRLAQGSSDTVISTLAEKAHGIVDPFLLLPVQPGERFWMFMLPNTITSLRHEWCHPAFGPAKPDVSQSEAFLRDVADDVGLSYDRLLDAAREWIHEGDRLTGGSEMEGESTPEDFWRHYQNVTGEVVPEEKIGNFFSCAC